MMVSQLKRQPERLDCLYDKQRPVEESMAENATRPVSIPILCASIPQYYPAFALDDAGHAFHILTTASMNAL